MRHVGEASCEEFIEGEEFTYDTVCIGGKPASTKTAQYLPPPLLRARKSGSAQSSSP
jgi:hypothetical protein